MIPRYPEIECDERIVLFPGTFDPFTVGHKSLVDRALPLFDRIIIAVGENDSKSTIVPVDDRIEAIARLYGDDPRVEVIAYSGLTVDACRQHQARWLLRGVRSVVDFEYERSMADINRMLAGIETVILYSLPEYASISSSIVRELEKYDQDTSAFIPTREDY
ncbi:MAG: pantetheine-phosphate adenylyltransferase [Lachnoclostridium sp.]|nr:pantetheine-phosphate adenylyltransferase [Lachnoclostridium sp.]